MVFGLKMAQLLELGGHVVLLRIEIFPEMYGKNNAPEE